MCDPREVEELRRKVEELRTELLSAGGGPRGGPGCNLLAYLDLAIPPNEKDAKKPITIAVEQSEVGISFTTFLKLLPI
jgi:hypothetical protein